MSDTKTETPVAVETLTAAATLRELLAAVPAGHWALYEDLIVHDGSAESAILTDARPGMDALVLSGEWWGEGLAVMHLLVALRAAAEPLVSWLEKTAADYATSMDEIECTNCGEAGGCSHPAEGEFCDGCEEPVPCRCVAEALAVARALNGTTPQEVSVG